MRNALTNHAARRALTLVSAIAVISGGGCARSHERDAVVDGECCSADGICVPVGSSDPSDPCRRCDPGVDGAGYSRVWSEGCGGAEHTAIHAPTGTECCFGNALDLGPDATGDGLGDVAIGDPTDGESRVYLYSGLGGSPTHVWGASDGGIIGHVVALGHDADGDGLADVAAGRRVPVGGVAPGAAFVWSGGSGEVIREVVPRRGDCDAIGAAVDFAGDFDGDSLADVVVSDPGRRGAECEGIVMLLSGATGALITDWHGPPGLGLDHLFFGPDADGDGTGDVLAVDASTGGPREARGDLRILSLGHAEPVLTQRGAVGDRLGRTAAFSADADGDELADVFATTDWRSFDLEEPSNVPVVVLSTGDPAPNEVTSGYAVAAGADLDGDGYGDLVVGEPFHDGGGRLRLVSGRSGATIRSLNANAIDPEAVIGFEVAVGGDVDGDGRSDVATQGFLRGRAVIYVFHSSR